MKTDDLIAILDAPTEPGPRLGARFAVLGALGMVIALAAVALVYGVRGDLSDAVIVTLLKSGFGAGAAFAVAPLALTLARPNTRVKAAARATLVFLGGCACVAVADAVLRGSFFGFGLWGGFPECLKRVPPLAAPIAALLFMAARRFAPTRLTLAGAAIGAMAAGLAIVPYALFCPMDYPAYVATWYLASILVCAAFGAAIGPFVLRWR